MNVLVVEDPEVFLFGNAWHATCHEMDMMLSLVFTYLYGGLIDFCGYILLYLISFSTLIHTEKLAVACKDRSKPYSEMIVD